jgi:hypothetical protein
MLVAPTPSTPRTSGTHPVLVKASPRPAAAPEQPVLQRAPRMGAAIFDNEREMGCGWACSSDGQPFYFASPTALPSDTLWVTSLDWNEYRQGAARMHNLRRVDYLKTAMSRIAADIGVRSDGEYARHASQVLGRVFQQATQIAMTLYGWKDASEDVLSETIRRCIAQPPRAPQHMRNPLLAAFQNHSSPAWPRGPYVGNTISVTLRLNRLEYAHRLLSLPVPDEGWTLVYEAGNAGESASPERFLNPDKPCIVEATVELGMSDPDQATLASFGTEPGKRSVGARRWISQPELAWLHERVKVHVSTAYECHDKRYLPDSARLPRALTSDPLFALSISAGLVAESHFQAIASTVYSRQSKGYSASAWAVWMRAYDRGECFKLAQSALRAGFQPISYGSGAVTVSLTKDRLPDLLEFSEVNGVAHPSFHPLFVEHGYALE